MNYINSKWGLSIFNWGRTDLSNNNEIQGKFEGLDALIHLAADPRPEASWESVKKNNIEATFNVYNEVKKAGVKKIIFASTNHTQHGDTLLTTPETLDLQKSKILSLENILKFASYWPSICFLTNSRRSIKSFVPRFLAN